MRDIILLEDRAHMTAKKVLNNGKIYEMVCVSIGEIDWESAKNNIEMDDIFYSFRTFY